MTDNKRIEWIDIAKGMTIILVVYCHIALAGIPVLHKYFTSFRMPFFFIMSGLLFSIQKYPTFTSFLKRRTKTLLLPYIYCTIIVATGYTLLEHGNLWSKLSNVLANGWGGVALWFIPVLFLTEMGYYCVCKISKKYTPVSLIVVAAIGYGISLFDFQNPYNILFVLTAIFYYGLGNYAKSRIYRRDFKMSNVVLVCAVAFICSLAIFLSKTPQEYAVNKLGDYFTYIAAISGSIMMMTIAIMTSVFMPRFLKEIPVFMGKNSYAILAFHQLLINAICVVTIFQGSLARILMWIILTIIILTTNKYTPFLFGKNTAKIK